MIYNILSIIWDPKIGWEIGSFTLHYYSLMFVISFALGYYIMFLIFKKDGESEKLLDPLFMYVVIGTIVGARLGHVIFYQPELFKEDFLSVFLPFQFKPHFKFTGFQGLASHGAAIMIIVMIYLYNRKYLKRNVLWLLDRIVIPISLAGFFIRLGNFFNSEIVGKPCSPDLFWAVKFIQQSPDYGPVVYRHPAQLYEGIGYLIIFIVMIYLYLKTDVKNKLGWLFGFALVTIFGVTRFVIEFFKEPQGDEIFNFLGLDTGQWLSIPFVIVGIYLMISSKNRIYKKNEKKDEKK